MLRILARYSPGVNWFHRSPNSLSEALLMLEMALKDETFQYEIRREFVLCDFLRTVAMKT